MATQPILIPCARGVPPILACELRDLGFPVLREHAAAVETEGVFDDTMRLNLHLRTGQRVLWPVATFAARTPDELYREVRRLPWEDWLFLDSYLCVTSSVDTPAIRDARFANLRCKDAVVDRFMERTGRRPDSGPRRDQAVLFLHWRNEQCTLYVDTSGESLSMRTYRKLPWKAPMQESLAAAVILSTGWRGGEPFVNPMCGSGTLAIEAALIAMNRPSGMLRANFGFMHVRPFNETLWSRIKQDASAAVRQQAGCRIVATDISPDAVDAARRNATAAGVADQLEFGVCDFAETPVPPEPGVVVINPEYGERLGEADQLAPVYKRIGDFLKQSCAGYRGYVFTGNLDLAKRVGLKPRQRTVLFNGAIECRLLAYDLYAGSAR